MSTGECSFIFLLFFLTTNALNIHPPNNELPKFIEGPIHTMTTAASTVALKCRTSNSQAIKWERNGIVVLPGGRYRVLPFGDLRIHRVMFSDSGEYSCIASNQNGFIKESANLTVKDRTRIIKDSPFKNVRVGQDALLQCHEIHDDALSIEIEWQKDGIPIDYETQHRHIKGNDNSLYIQHTVPSDSGEYTCVARTEVDEDKAIVTLIVQNVPNPPEIENVICNGDEAEIIWKELGDNRSPILFYSLEYNTSFTPHIWEEVKSRIHWSKMRHSFFMNPGASYSFRVKAHNKLGASAPSGTSKTCTTQPGFPQQNPENVRTESIDPTKLVITWTPLPQIHHAGPNLFYRVFWKRDDSHSEWESKDILDWKENKLVINDQPTFVRYRIKVVAINDLGEAKEAANEIIGFSGEDRPLLAPKNFKMLELVSSTAAYLQWEPVSPESLRGHFEGYKIQAWAANGGEESLKEIKVEKDKHEILFTDLKPYTKNFVRICAYNSRFDGPSTLISFNTPEGVPSEVQNLKVYPLDSSAILVTWDKPLETNGRLTGYRIYYAEIRGSYVGEKISSFGNYNDPDITSAKLGNLRPDTKYRIFVSAQTAMGEGREMFYEIRTLRPDRRPQEPSEPGFKWEPLTSIKITWQPFNGLPTGTHFFTQYKVKGETEWHDTPRQEDDVVQIVNGLKRNTTYEFRVVSVDGSYRKESEIQEISIP